ncbi:hypothetical protein GGR50DRAFT_665892 [Xylaria sp. CBS 124048]|nr:hypothetical protein GGR50DRAFT_665892 [Xylaria sp. CBS 124048]
MNEHIDNRTRISSLANATRLFATSMKFQTERVHPTVAVLLPFPLNTVHLVRHVLTAPPCVLLLSTALGLRNIDITPITSEPAIRQDPGGRRSGSSIRLVTTFAQISEDGMAKYLLALRQMPFIVILPPDTTDVATSATAHQSIFGTGDAAIPSTRSRTRPYPPVRPRLLRGGVAMRASKARRIVKPLECKAMCSFVMPDTSRRCSLIATRC